MSALINIIEAYVKAHNSHDLDKTMAFYTDDVEIEISGMVQARGKAQARLVEEFDIAFQSEFAYRDPTENGDFVSAVLIEHSEFLRIVGIEKLVYERWILRIRNGLICSVRAVPAQQSLADWSKAWQAIIRWTEENDLQQLDILMPNGEIRYDLASSLAWLELARRWRSAQNALK